MPVLLAGCQPMAHIGASQHSHINGTVPPGKAGAAEQLQLLVPAPSGDGRQMLVYRTLRLPGTRAPIHFHAMAASAV